MGMVYATYPHAGDALGRDSRSDPPSQLAVGLGWVVKRTGYSLMMQRELAGVSESSLGLRPVDSARLR